MQIGYLKKAVEVKRTAGAIIFHARAYEIHYQRDDELRAEECLQPCFSLLLAVAGFLIVRNKPEDLGFASPNPVVFSDGGQVDKRSWLQNLINVVSVPVSGQVSGCSLG